MREAVLSLSDEEVAALGFDDLVTECREAGIREIELLEDEGTSCAPLVTVEERLDGDALEALDCVEGWELVAEREETCRYLLELTAPALSESAAEDHDDLLGSCEPSVTDRGLLLSMVGSQDAIREMIRNYEAAGTTPELCELGEFEGDDGTLDALTARQREVVETAYAMGFYEVPREATTEDVAAELDLDAGTVSEHLQRAERNLLAGQLQS